MISRREGGFFLHRGSGKKPRPPPDAFGRRLPSSESQRHAAMYTPFIARKTRELALTLEAALADRGTR